jgi:hypothetical protein
VRRYLHPLVFSLVGPPIVVMAIVAVLLTRKVLSAANDHLVEAVLASVGDEYDLEIQAVVEADVFSGTAHATDIVVDWRDGRPLLTADEARITFPGLLQQRLNAHIEVTGGRLWVRRDESGWFELTRLLRRKPEQKPIELPVDVLLRDCEVMYSDASGAQPAQALAQHVEASIQVIATSGRASASAYSPQTGACHVSARWDENGGTASASAQQVEGATARRVLLSYFTGDALRRVRIGDVRGHVAAAARWGPGGKVLDWVASARAEAGRFEFDKYKVDGASMDISGSPAAWTFRGETGMEGASARLDGLLAVGDRGVLVHSSVVGSGPAIERFWKYADRQDESPATGPFSVDGTITGNISAPAIRGWAHAAEGRWGDYAVQNPLAYIDVRAKESLSLRRASGSFHGRPVTADVHYDFASGQLSAAAEAESLDLASFEQLAKEGVSGAADVDAIVEGQLDDLDAVVNIRVPEVAVTRDLAEDQEPWSGMLGDLDARLVWSGGSLVVPLIRVSGDHGRLQASGSYDTEARALDFSFDTTGVLLDALKPTVDAGGTAFAAGTLTGPADHPRLDSRVEVFSPTLAGHEAALLSAQLGYQDGVLGVASGFVRKGAATAEVVGGLDLNAETPTVRDLVVSVRDLDPRQVLRPAGYEWPVRGFVNASGVVNGPVDDLSAEFSVESPEAYVDLVEVERLGARVAYGGRRVAVSDVHAEVGGGSVDGYAAIDLDGPVAAAFSLHGLQLDLLSAYLDPATALSGELNGSAGISGNADDLRAAAFGELTNVSLGGLDLGSGPIEAQYADRGIGGSLELAGPGRALDARLARFDIDERTVDASLNANTSLDDVRRVLRRLLPNVEPSTWRVAQKVDGKLAIDAQARGEIADPDLPFTASLPSLTVGRAQAGTIVAEGTLRKDSYNFHRVEWDLSGGVVSASGSYAPGGEVSGTLEASNFDAGILAPLAPALEGLQGFADVTALAQGPASSPEVDMTVGLTDFGRGELRVDSALFSLVTVRDGAIQTDGAVLQKLGYVARLSGSVPFSYDPFGISGDGPLSAELSIPEQDLKGLQVFLPGIDAERTAGIIRGPGPEDAADRPIKVSLSGTPDQPAWFGEVIVEGDSFALQGIDESLTGVRGKLRLQDETIAVDQFEAGTGSGGSLSAQAQAAITEGLDSPVSGSFSLTGVTVRQTDRDVTKRLAATVDGSGSLSGTLREPVVLGDLRLGSADIPIPAGWEAGAEKAAPPVDPEFGVTVAIAPDTWLRTKRMEARVRGTARLQRRLSSPLVNASIEVLEGKIRLPTTNLTLEPGGSITVTYDGQRGAEALAAINLDLKARTNLTAAGPLGSPVNYRIDMDVTGSLLEEGGLHMTATSSPPDLSEQRILALLGHQGFLDAFSGGDLGAALQDEFKDILGAAVLPALFEAIDPELAAKVGLETFALTYNRYEPITLNVSKELFDGLSLHYRRGLSGVEQRFEVKLLWRLPIPERVSGSFNLGWAYDDQTEHRISIEWGLQF